MVARSTLADANEAHDWRIFADFAQILIGIARPLYASDAMGVELDRSLYALDSTTIDLCLSLFPWAKFPQAEGCHQNAHAARSAWEYPSVYLCSDGKMHDVNMLDRIEPEAGAFYVMDRAYIDFERLYQFTLGSAFFVTRSKSNIPARRRTHHPVDRSTGVTRSNGDSYLVESASAYPEKLRRRHLIGDAKTGKRLKFFDQQLHPSRAPPSAQIYKQRWQVELVLQMDQTALAHQGRFSGTSENAVKTQIWIAISVYVLVAIVCKRLRLDSSLYQILQDSECYPVRENPHFTSTSELQRHIRLTRYF